jgi:hypothetical protein
VTRISLRRAAAGVIAAAFVSGVVACSSAAAPADQSNPSPTAQSSASPTESAGNHAAFTQCMTDNGVPAPPEGRHAGGPPRDGAPPEGAPPQGAPQHDGSATPPAPPGVDQDTWDKAMQACSSLAPAPPQN